PYSTPCRSIRPPPTAALFPYTTLFRSTVIATTPTQRGILEASDYDVPKDKICVIPPGYDDQRFFPVSLASKQAIKQELDLEGPIDRKSTRLNSSHVKISYAVFCLKKKR